MDFHIEMQDNVKISSAFLMFTDKNKNIDAYRYVF